MLKSALTLLAVGAVSWAAAGPTSQASPLNERELAGVATVSEGAERGERRSVAPPAAEPAAQAGALDPLLAEVVALTNQERARAGLPPLTIDAKLNEAAQNHSNDMARRGVLTHYGPNGESPGDRISAAGYDFRMWAENAAMGFRSAATVMNGWMNSPGHRANILNPSVTEVGVGIAYTSSGSPYWTQVFAAPR